MEDEPSNIFEKLFDDFKAGNPLFLVAGLFVVVLIGVVWVWQIITAPVTVLPTRFSHPTTAARIKTLTAQPPQPSATPAASFFD